MDKLNPYFLLLWPACYTDQTKNHIKKLLIKESYKVKEVRSFSCDLAEFCQFITVIYQGEPWCKTKKIPTISAINKACSCYGTTESNKQVTIFLVYGTSPDPLLSLREQLRTKLKKEKHSIHAIENEENSIEFIMRMQGNEFPFSDKPLTKTQRFLLMRKISVAKILQAIKRLLTLESY